MTAVPKKRDQTAGIRAARVRAGKSPEPLSAEEIAEIRAQNLAKGRVSRPKLSAEVRQVFIDGMSHGLTATKAAALARIPSRTMDDWIRKGRASLDLWAEEVEQLPEDAPVPELNVYGSFFLDAAEAIAKRELKWLKGIAGWDGKGQGWTKEAWLLERTSPNDYALRDGVTRTPIGGASTGRTVSEVSLNAVSLILVQARSEERRGGEEC